MMKEDEILFAFIRDKIVQCEEEDIISYSYFLDVRQRSLVESFCQGRKQNQIFFWGGYEDAERTVCFFLPWYEQKDTFAPEQHQDLPLSLLRITSKGDQGLSHRDYLGALMGLGIKRELVGDILVSSHGCDMIVFRKVVPYLMANFTKAGRVSLEIKELPFASIALGERRCSEERMSVSSLRLDVIVAAVFHLSRGNAVEAISAGRVFLNGKLQEKPEKILSQGDKLALRGAGKMVLKEIGGKTRKEKIGILIEKYQ